MPPGTDVPRRELTMSVSTGRTTRSQPVSRNSLTPPPWACEWTGTDARTRVTDGFELTVIAGGAASLLGVRVEGAAALSSDRFEQVTLNAYRLLRIELAKLPCPHPVRFWNYLPAINESMGDGIDRYMVFNSGRYAALGEWFGGPNHLPAMLPAASGVGHRGGGLMIHCLALARPGDAIENPRQVPALRYSARYGPLPPCFARATRVTHPVDGSPALLVAGTASIRGEQSMHLDNLRRQLDETLENLRALVDPAGLAAFTDLRAYHVRSADAEPIEEFLLASFGRAPRLEMIRADLCRPDLLVEIEGLAVLPPRNGS